MRWAPLLVASAFLLTVPGAAAETDCVEPCGWIVPIIELDFDDKPLCGSGRLIYADEAPEDCLSLMGKGESVTLNGVVRITWDAQEEPTYPISPDEPIVVEFSGTQSNPKWMELSFEPKSYELGFADLYNPDNYDEDLEGNPILVFNWERDVSVTLSRTGDPDNGWMKKIDSRNGVLANFMKARSTASGDRYREAFGVEEFRMNAYEAPDIEGPEPTSQSPAEDASAPTALLLLGALGVALLARRR